MVIDTSALVAILFGEPEADAFAALIEADPVRLMSAASALETSIVIFSELGEEGVRDLDLLLHKARSKWLLFRRSTLPPRGGRSNVLARAVTTPP